MSQTLDPRWALRHLTIGCTVFCAMLLIALPRASDAIEVAGLKPAAPQPAATKPGLSVRYWFNLVRDMDGMKYWMQDKGRPGKPLPMLNYRSGAGRVLSTNQPDGVMAKITGFINFDKPGTYQLWMHNNDGAMLTVGEKLIINDGRWHSSGNTMNGPIQVKIGAPGWYPLEVLYFERKGTSTLELFWLTPGATGEKVHVPTAALAHTGK